MHYTYHDNPKTDLDVNNVIVFATSLKADLKKGFGPIALKKHGAQKGKPMGFSAVAGVGKSFGIPFEDKDGFDLRTQDILRSVDMFLEFSIKTGYELFHITDVTEFIPRVQPEVIARLFVGAHKNCIFPITWSQWLEVPTVPDEK